MSSPTFDEVVSVGSNECAVWIAVIGECIYMPLYTIFKEDF